MILLAYGGMWYELIGQTEPYHTRRIAMVAHPFEHCTSHTSISHAIFYAEHPLVLFSYGSEHGLVEGFEESQVIVSDAQCAIALCTMRLLHLTDSLGSEISYRTKGDDRHALSFFQTASLAHLNCF